MLINIINLKKIYKYLCYLVWVPTLNKLALTTSNKKIIYSAIFTIMPLISFSKNTFFLNTNLAISGVLGGYLLVAILLVLLVIIWGLIRHIRKSTDFFVDSWKNEQRKSSGKKNVAGLSLLLLTSISAINAYSSSDSLQTTANISNTAGLPNFLFYLIISLIILEVVVILFLISQAKLLLKKKKDLESRN